MSAPLEDYALIGDCQTAALVGRSGSIDWLCFPRFDSGACFAALLGTPDHGRWLLAPATPIRATRRKYRGESLVLETEFETDEGVVAVIDCMPQRTAAPDVVRLVEGRRGRVPMRMELVARFDYGSIVPWVRSTDDGLSAIAGPDRLWLRTPAPLRGEGLTTVSDFTVGEGESVPFVLTWTSSSDAEPPEAHDARALVASTEEWWRAWSARCTYEGEWRDAVIRSLITLKAMTFAPTGGIVAAVTTSLPERIGGVRNWDYRICWLRDATFTLYSLLGSGYTDEARAWREWLLRAIAGVPSQFNIMYGLGGERRLTELELSWLPGYEGSKPVRIGNAAYMQHQLDVYGEVLDVMHQCRRMRIASDEYGWRLESALLRALESDWRTPDEGIWEVRGPSRHFTHSKVMAWVAFDRAVKAVESFGCEGPVDRWRALRDEVHAEVCARGFDAELGAFVQSYGSKLLDASLLMMPLVGFLPAHDVRMRGTIEAIERTLRRDGFVARYETVPAVDGLPEGEGAFLACSFWLVDCLALLGRMDDARALFERLLAIRNDVGLLAEEYDPEAKRLLGNFPQAFSHVSLVNSATNLTQNAGPATLRPTT
jgi:GH15 family glucan-1,4-alpha-glucosidase